MIELPSGKLGLCLSGGGSKGAYGVGVIQYLFEVLQRRDIGIIYGTSTGSLIASMLGLSIATSDPSYVTELIHIYKNVLDADILKPHHEIAYAVGGEMGVLAATLVAGGSSIFDTKPLGDLIDRYMTPDNWKKLINAGKRKKNPIEVGFCIADIQSGDSYIVSNISHPKPSVLRDALLASASQPVFMPTTKINDVAPNHQFVDGGLVEYTPVEKIFESPLQDKLDAVLSIAMDPLQHNPSTKEYTSTTDILLRTLSLFVDGVYFNDMKVATLWNLILKIKSILPAPEWQTIENHLPPPIQEFVKNKLTNRKYLPIYYFNPSSPLDINSLKFEQDKMRKLIRQGFKDAMSGIKNENITVV